MAEIVQKELSYKIVGLLFRTHKDLGLYRNEKQYCDHFEKLLREESIAYTREYKFFENKNKTARCICDFIIENKMILEFKAKNYITKEDYYQMKRYLTTLNFQLGIIANFRQKRLAPKRVLNSEYNSNAANIIRMPRKLNANAAKLNSNYSNTNSKH